MVKTLKCFLENNSRRLPFRYTSGSQVAPAEALQDYFLPLRLSFLECLAPFELPSHFIPSSDLKSCTKVQRPGELKTSPWKKGSRGATGEGKWAVIAQPLAWEGLSPSCANTAHPWHLLGTQLSRDSLPLSPDLLLPAQVGPSAFQPAWMGPTPQVMRLFEGSLWRDTAAQKPTFSLNPTERQSCGCICNTPRYCTSTSALSGLTHCTQRVRPGPPSNSSS